MAATLYVMAGMSFAGKTTLARAIHAEVGLPLIEPDAIAVEKGWQLESGALSLAQWHTLMEEGMKRARALLRAGQDVLFDTTATSRAKRDLFRGLAAECGATTRFIAVCISREEAMRRWERNNISRERFTVSWEDFDACAREWELPSEDEEALIYQAGEAILSWIDRNFQFVGPAGGRVDAVEGKQ